MAHLNRHLKSSAERMFSMPSHVHHHMQSSTSRGPTEIGTWKTWQSMINVDVITCNHGHQEVLNLQGDKFLSKFCTIPKVNMTIYYINCQWTTCWNYPVVQKKIKRIIKTSPSIGTTEQNHWIQPMQLLQGWMHLWHHRLYPPHNTHPHTKTLWKWCYKPSSNKYTTIFQSWPYITLTNIFIAPPNESWCSPSLQNNIITQQDEDNPIDINFIKNQVWHNYLQHQHLTHHLNKFKKHHHLNIKSGTIIFNIYMRHCHLSKLTTYHLLSILKIL